jgi:hypothetical protein
LAPCAFPRAERDVGDPVGAHRRGSKKKLWEHQAEAVAETSTEGYGSQTASDLASSAPAETPAVQEPVKGRRRKGKVTQEPAAGDPQIDLF